MHRHQLGAIREGRFNLNVMNHLGDTLHYLIAAQISVALTHQLGHGLAIASAL